MKLKKDQKYIFATDLDGTFLTSFNSSLHIDSYKAIELIRKSGNIFVITTGRSSWWTEHIFNQLNLVDASIHFAGALIHNPNDKNFSDYRASINTSKIKKLCKDINIWSFANGAQAVGRKYQAYFSKNDPIDNLFFNSYEFIISFSKNKKDPNELIKEIEKSIGKNYIIRTWDFFEDEIQVIISPEGTSKSNALKKVANYYGVKKSNVIYFGDNVNDLDALDWAGISFSPSNAKKEAKKVAKFILEKSNNEGAVPKKIIELIENME